MMKTWPERRNRPGRGHSDLNQRSIAMTQANSTAGATGSKPADAVPADLPTRARPAKPYPDFPLYPHPMGYWAKKVRGRMHYFGPWEDPDGALAKYNEQKDDLHAGNTPRAKQKALTVKDAVNAYLNEKDSRVEAGELSARTRREYKEATDEVVKEFGKRRRVADLRSDDFAALRKRMAQSWGPTRLGNMIQTVRSIFKFAYESELIERPVRFGPSFKKPSKKVLRLHRAAKGVKMFAAEEVHRLLGAAGTQIRAMILLGVNAGMGNTDCGRLPLTALNLDAGWLDYPRPKTGIARRCPLWPETVAAIRNALAKRPKPKDPADATLVFVTKYRGPWAQTAITHEMTKLLSDLDINGRRNFYALRHTFRTIADRAKDQPAADFIMGDARDDMASVYREGIEDDRLQAVADYVRAWLLADDGQAEQPDVIPLKASV
jgi:integrase